MSDGGVELEFFFGVLSCFPVLVFLSNLLHPFAATKNSIQASNSWFLEPLAEGKPPHPLNFALCNFPQKREGLSNAEQRRSVSGGLWLWLAKRDAALAIIGCCILRSIFFSSSTETEIPDELHAFHPLRANSGTEDIQFRGSSFFSPGTQTCLSTV